MGDGFACIAIISYVLSADGRKTLSFDSKEILKR
jgi:hypothetical protein